MLRYHLLGGSIERPAQLLCDSNCVYNQQKNRFAGRMMVVALTSLIRALKSACTTHSFGCLFPVTQLIKTHAFDVVQQIEKLRQLTSAALAVPFEDIFFSFIHFDFSSRYFSPQLTLFFRFTIISSFIYFLQLAIELRTFKSKSIRTFTSHFLCANGR